MKSSTVSSFLIKILNLLKSHFPKVFQINTFGKPREYSIGSILALMIFSARNSSFSFRKIVKLIRDVEYILTLLKFNKTPYFSVLFKTYKKYIEPNINLYISKIGVSLNKNSSIFYLDSSSLISNKHDKSAKWGISTHHDWYKSYKLHMICSSNGIPMCFSISTANVHDSKCDNLLENLSREYSSTIVFADKGYDSSKLIDSADKLGISLICPINKRNAKKLKVSNMSKSRFRNYEFLSSPTGKKLYKKRWEIERLFGNLKENYNIDNHRVRGLNRKIFNVSFKILLFSVEKAIMFLIYFCNTLLKIF